MVALSNKPPLACTLPDSNRPAAPPLPMLMVLLPLPFKLAIVESPSTYPVVLLAPPMKKVPAPVMFL